MAAVNDYIFLTQRDFLRQRSFNIQALTAQKKADILSKMVQQHENRLASFAGGDLTKARAVLNNEDLAKELNQSINTNSGIQVAFPQTWEAAQQLLAAFEGEKEKAVDLSGKIDQFLTAVDDEYYHSNLREAYYGQVKDNFIANRSLGRQIGGKATPEERIYASLMDSKYQGKAFYFDRTPTGAQLDRNKLNSSIPKLYALKGLIDAGGGSDDDFWLGAGQRIKKWMEDFLSSVAEVAIYEAYVKGESAFFKDLKGSINTRYFGKMTGNTRSGVGFSTRFIEDPTLTAMYQRLSDHMGNGRAYSIVNDRTSKSDIQLKINQGGVTGTAGISVKDYRTNDITDSSKVYNMHTQSNTPLLTFLLRECEYSTTELVTLMNIGAALYDSSITGAYIGTSGGDALAGSWEAIKENAKYRGILATLAGLEGTSDQIFYMALNGRIFTMSQVLRNIQENALKGNNVSIVHGLDEGLNRGVFQRINRQNIVTRSRGQEAAWERSQNVEAQLMQHMYNVKVSTSINLYNMAKYLT